GHDHLRSPRRDRGCHVRRGLHDGIRVECTARDELQSERVDERVRAEINGTGHATIGRVELLRIGRKWQAHAPPPLRQNVHSGRAHDAGQGLEIREVHWHGGRLVVVGVERLDADPEHVVEIDARRLVRIGQPLLHDVHDVHDDRESQGDLRGHQKGARAAAPQGAEECANFHESSYCVLRKVAGASLPMRHAGYKPASTPVSSESAMPSAMTGTSMCTMACTIATRSGLSEPTSTPEKSSTRSAASPPSVSSNPVNPPRRPTTTTSTRCWRTMSTRLAPSARRSPEIGAALRNFASMSPSVFNTHTTRNTRPRPICMRLSSPTTSHMSSQVCTLTMRLLSLRGKRPCRF